MGDRSLCKSTLVRVAAWSENCSSWRVNMHLQSSLWMRLTASVPRVSKAPRVVIQRSSEQCWSCSISWTASSRQRTSKLSWPPIVSISLDPALLRPGRIDRKIEFPPPSVEARADILRIHSRKMNLTRGINLNKIAEKMNGCSGAELKGVCTEAGMYALRERRVHVTQEDFDLATAKVLNKHDDKEVSLGKLWK